MVRGNPHGENSWEKIKKGTSYLISRLFLMAGLAAIIMIALALAEETYKRYQIQQEVAELRDQAEEIEGDNQHLKGLIKYFETTEYQEKEAKEKLSLQKEGEQVILIKEKPPEHKNSTSNNSTQTAPKEDDRTNPQRWWDYFFAS